MVANKIRKQWNLGLEPLPDLIDIFEEHGIKYLKLTISNILNLTVYLPVS